jgi:MoaA/NifB/PqqE/SkfB family radical SAM enzyme
MNVKDAHNYLTEAASISDLKSFMVFGGEPMLYSARAIAIFKKAHQLNIPKISMLTNGIWGKDKQEAETLALKLKAAGLNTLGISVDAFHLQYIPLEYPRNAAQASLKAGIEQVTWNVAVMESINATNQYDKKTSQILKTLEPVGIEAHIHKVMPVGRALQKIPKHFQHSSLDGPCEGEQPIGNVLTNPDSICIEPSGSVNICWDLTIGNAKKTPLGQILSEYDWRKNPIIRTLVEEGPLGLLKFCEKLRYGFQQGQYINKCHLCIEIRKYLGTSSFYKRTLRKS